MEMVRNGPDCLKVKSTTLAFGSHTGCERKGEVKDGVQVFGFSNWKDGVLSPRLVEHLIHPDPSHYSSKYPMPSG